MTSYSLTICGLLFSVVGAVAQNNGPLVAAIPSATTHPTIENIQADAAADEADSIRLIPPTKPNPRFSRCLIVAAPLMALGAIGTADHHIINKYEFKEERDEHFETFHTSMDNYLQYAPAATMYAMNILGYKGQHNVWKQTTLLLRAELIMSAMVFPLKKYTRVVRPDGSEWTSFPSGHTAQAFVGAEMLRKEYGSEHPWVAVGGYVAASSVGVLRMLNNRHWITDVMTGAGIGILSVNLAYLTEKIKWPFNNHKKIQVSPTFTGTGAGFYLNYHLGK